MARSIRIMAATGPCIRVLTEENTEGLSGKTIGAMRNIWGGMKTTLEWDGAAVYSAGLFIDAKLIDQIDDPDG